MEDNYLVVVIAALQDPENGIQLQTEVKKKRERKVFDGGQIVTALSGFGLNDKAKGVEIAQRLLDAGMIKSSNDPTNDFVSSRTYTFGDRILMDRQYIIDQLPTAIAYFAQNPYRRSAAAKNQEKGKGIFSRLKNLIDREEPPADPADSQLEGEVAMQVYAPILSLHTVSALDPDLIEEDTDELMFMISPEDPFPLVKAATIPKLIERLTFEKFIDIRFQSKFLLTFRAFMPPSALFDGLMRRYKSLPEDVLVQGKPPADEHELQKRRKLIQLRVITVVSRWVQDYYEDFLDPQQRTKLVSFIEQDVAPPFPSVHTGMKLGLSQRQAYERRRKPLSESIAANAAANFNPDNLSVQCRHHLISLAQTTELAVQLSLYDFDLFVAIPPTQWVGVQFSKAGKESKAREILRSIAHFNRISKWVAADILKKIQIKARTASLNRFIQLAGRLRDMHSFNMAMAVFSALNSAPVRRLAASWADLSPDAAMKFKELEEVFTYTASYKTYRAALRKSPAPCIPYLGIYLTELTFIEEANPGEIYGLINFQKQALVARVVEEVQFYQRFPYRQSPDSSAFAWLQVAMLPSLTEEECWSHSLRVEPRNAMESLEKVLMEEERLRQQVKQLEVRVSDLEKENGGLKQQVSTLDSHLRANLRMTSGSQPPRPQSRQATPGSAIGIITRESHARSLAGRVAPKVQDTLRGSSGSRSRARMIPASAPGESSPLAQARDPFSTPDRLRESPTHTHSPAPAPAERVRESPAVSPIPTDRLRDSPAVRTGSPVVVTRNSSMLSRSSGDAERAGREIPLPQPPPPQRSPRFSGAMSSGSLASLASLGVRPPSPLPTSLPPPLMAPPPPPPLSLSTSSSPVQSVRTPTSPRGLVTSQALQQSVIMTDPRGTAGSASARSPIVIKPGERSKPEAIAALPQTQPESPRSRPTGKR